MNYYQTIPELGLEGRMNTPEEFEKIKLPKDLKGKSLLDIGCNMGAFLIEAIKRGARAEGIEPAVEWRVLAKGIALELGYFPIVYEKKEDVIRNYDVVLLLSILHNVGYPQELLNWAWEHTDKLLIVEINDRLQSDKVKLPEGAVKVGTNKDNRSVWHIKK